MGLKGRLPINMAVHKRNMARPRTPSPQEKLDAYMQYLKIRQMLLKKDLKPISKNIMLGRLM
jgi:hypothetical protein